VKVHYHAEGAVAAPCGYKFNPRLRGLDSCSTWNKRVAVPVSCRDCLLFYQPKPWKVPSWEGLGKKVR